MSTHSSDPPPVSPSVWAWHAPRMPRSRLTALPGAKWELMRRDARHGTVRRVRRNAAGTPAEWTARWNADEPIHLPGWVRPRNDSDRRAVACTRRLFERVAVGRDFGPEVWRRLEGRRDFIPTGSSVDLSDTREIEKVHVDRASGGRGARPADDLWAKLSWISTDERDESMRIRFSFGSEYHEDWSTDPKRAAAADELARAIFPECALVVGNRRLVGLVDRLAGRKVRFSERIVFANAPNGGAPFHHDAETRQLGVLYGQLSGRTAWLALPKRRLATFVAERAKEEGGALARAAGTPARAMRALDGPIRDDVDALVNADPQLTRRLVEAGALIILEPGDALLLPSRGPDDSAWHSVFALGSRPSLAHSYGIFAKRGK